MHTGTRECLPRRVREMMSALCRGAEGDIPALIEDGCLCAERRLCDLWSACAGIHRAFAPAEARG